MIRLTNWYLENYKETESLARGIVSGHDRLPDGMFIHTSRLEGVELDESGQQIILLTHSGNHYYLDWSAINLKGIQRTQEVLGQFGIPVDFLENCAELAEQAEKKLLSEAERILNNRELLLLTAYDRAFFKNAEGVVREISPYTHVGMFQDSILITDWERGEVDFRYFPKGMFAVVIEPYHWSDGLDAVLIDNKGEKDIEFVGTERTIYCKPGEITRIESAEYRGEGLFSPDVVNGKWAFSAMTGKDGEQERT